MVLLELSKAYDNLDHGMLLQTLVGYREGPKIRGLLSEFWLRQGIVNCQNVFLGPQLRATRGTTKGGLALPALFNVTVESVVRHWLSLTVEDQ